MNLVVGNHNILLVILVTFIVSFGLTFVVKKLAVHVNALDIPNERKIHTKPTPRLGGLAIFGAFLFGYIFYGDVTAQMISILIGAIILIIVGIFDDIKPIKARYKFIFQIISAAIVVFYGQIYFNEITLLGFKWNFEPFIAYTLSILFIVAITNSINLIDGLDGLAAGVSTIYFITIGIIAFILNRLGGLDIMLSIIMIGSTLGFLFHNFPPAKIFMGDTGSLFLGFMIAVIALLGFKVATITSLVIPIVILGIPIFDTLLAIFRRLLNKQNIGVADKEHFHHQLLKLKFSRRASILIIYAINILFSAVSIFYVLGNNQIAITIYIVLMILFLYIVLKTDILYEQKKDLNYEKFNR